MMCVNLSSMSIFQASKFLEDEFATYNVMQVTFVSPSILFSSFLSDLFVFVKSRCSLMLIQECHDDYAKCTFVFKGHFLNFYKFLKLKTKLLVQKFGKEVYIYV